MWNRLATWLWVKIGKSELELRSVWDQCPGSHYFVTLLSLLEFYSAVSHFWGNGKVTIVIGNQWLHDYLSQFINVDLNSNDFLFTVGMYSNCGNSHWSHLVEGSLAQQNTWTLESHRPELKAQLHNFQRSKQLVHFLTSDPSSHWLSTSMNIKWVFNLISH